MSRVLITGVGSGLGEALAHAYLEKGDRVDAIGRHLPESLERRNISFCRCDLSETARIAETTAPFVEKKRYDIVILNAGMLGEIRRLVDSDLDALKRVMELNLWANKELVDTLLQHAHIAQAVAISSGAAVNGSKGWGGYALSKAALNMLMKLYAAEAPQIRFNALAPGVIDTPMVRRILENVDEKTYPSAERLRKGEIQTTAQAAKRLLETFPKLLTLENGAFYDIRKM